MFIALSVEQIALVQQPFDIQQNLYKHIDLTNVKQVIRIAFFIFIPITMHTLRLMHADDLPEIMDIQLEIYSDALQESAEIIAQRLAQVPDLALVAEDAQGICGYLFSYRSQRGSITPLDGLFVEPEKSDCLYLHDLGVAPRALKRGIGPSLVKHKLQIARQAGLQHCSLVSVQNSASFWQRLGFQAQSVMNRQQTVALHSYGVPAVYMQKAL